MIPWFGLALAAEALVVPTDGPPLPGRPTVLHIAYVDDEGRPEPGASVEADAGDLVAIPHVDAPPGAAAYRWIPPVEPGAVRFVLRGSDGEAETSIAVTRSPPGLASPELIDGIDGAEVVIPVRAGRPLAPSELRVALSEPSAVSIRPTADGADVTVALRADGARAVVAIFGLEGVATDPIATRIAVVHRRALAFDLEPGARMTVRVGGRSSGPHRAGADGQVRFTLEQRPGDTTAELTVADDLGNQLTSAYVLSARPAGALAIAQLGPVAPRSPPPDVVVAATRPTAAWHAAPAPSCSLAGRDVPTRRISPGLWRVVLPPDPPDAEGARLACRTPEGRGEALIVARADAPTALQIEVWPAEVTSDSPRAAISVHLVDALGRRLDASAVGLVAKRGTVERRASAGASVRAEYAAEESAISVGSDVLRASLFLPPGDGPPVGLRLGYRADGDAFFVTALAVDPGGRPVPGAAIQFEHRGVGARAVTDARGRAILRVPGGPGAVSAQLEPSGPSAAAVLVPIREDWGPQPGGADLEASVTIPVLAGRIAAVRFDPVDRVVPSGGGATFTLTVRSYDRAGALVDDIAPVVSASAGTVEPARRATDGAYLLVYRPPEDGRGRVVQLRASSPSGEAVSDLELRVEPRPTLLAVGLGVGATSNLGELKSPLVAFDLDVGLPATARGATLRLGVSTFGYARSVSTEFGDVRRQVTLVPIAAGALLRRRLGPFGVQAGGGALIVPFRTEETFAGERLPTRAGLAPPGGFIAAGVARRAGPGEFLFEARTNLIFSNGDRVGLTGMLGGVAGVLSYRLLID